MAVREWRDYSRGCPEYMVPSATAARCYAILLQNASLPLPLACLFVSLRARVEYARLRQVLVRKHTWDGIHERWRYSLLVEARGTRARGKCILFIDRERKCILFL